MGKLYIFAIGGTGARVLRSFTMLLASGLKVNADTIIPIIIDTDSQNSDTLRAIKLLNNYRSIKKEIPLLKDSFFHNNISALGELNDSEGKKKGIDNFLLPIPNTSGKSFEDYINYSYIPDYETKCLLELLYSQQNLKDSLTHGFLGSPNVGCVVLDSINQTEEWKNFGNLFKSEDRIFIISSIFGGTGAAGFPLLLKNFSTTNSSLSNSGALEKAVIGAVSVLPYFALKKNDESRIDSSTFITKTISALSYYEDNIKSVHAHYYIGDSLTNSYENVEGGNSQKNDAHFIELASALSIFDFMEIPEETLISAQQYKEYAVNNAKDKLFFEDLGNKNTNAFAKNFTSLKLFQLFKSEIKKQIGSTFAVNNNINEELFNSAFDTNITDFLSAYEEYLKEISNNTRGFNPFSSDNSLDLSNLINGKSLGKTMFGRSSLNERHFINECKSFKSNKATPKEKFIDLMFNSTNSLFDKNLKHLFN